MPVNALFLFSISLYRKLGSFLFCFANYFDGSVLSTLKFLDLFGMFECVAFLTVFVCIMYFG